ncbi:YihY/virulence factor BrkB family protein [Lactobacillaceae bacterium Scapto_B20]
MNKINPKIKTMFNVFMKHYKNANVSDSAVVVAFYLLLSIFPILIILGSVLSFANISSMDILNYLHPLLPPQINQTLSPIIVTALNGDGKQLSLGIVITVWSASRAIAALKRTVDSAYGIINQRGAMLTRAISFLWMLLIIIAMVAALVFFNFSNSVFLSFFHVPQIVFTFVGAIRIPVTMGIMFILLTFMYYIIPAAATKFRYVWAGSLTVTIGLLLLSQGFSIYLQYFAKGFSTYKALGTFIMLMFWLYFVGILVLIGAVINATLQELRQGELKPKNIRNQIKKAADNRTAQLKKD